jgi:peroxiredoxin
MPRPRWIWIALFLASVSCRDDGPRQDDPLPDVGTVPGRLAPPLQGRAEAGSPFRLDASGAQATLLLFYRGAHCGLCRERLRALEAHRREYEAADVRIVAATLDAPGEVARTVSMLGLGFPVVSVDTAAFSQWDIVDQDRAVPLPASFLLDARGVIRYRHRGRNAADRASDVELLAAIEQMRSGPPAP